MWIGALARHNIPYTSRGIFYVFSSPGNKVDVTMEDGLSSGLTVVNADVEGLYRLIPLRDATPLLF